MLETGRVSAFDNIIRFPFSWDKRSTGHAIGANGRIFLIAGSAVAGVTVAESPVMLALAGGAGGGASNDAAGLAVQCPGT